MNFNCVIHTKVGNIKEQIDVARTEMFSGKRDAKTIDNKNVYVSGIPVSIGTMFNRGAVHTKKRPGYSPTYIGGNTVTE